jgi:NAD(P)-dependent dehydrogenase (short-subunit alcohol dehydrogenase family)
MQSGADLSRLAQGSGSHGQRRDWRRVRAITIRADATDEDQVAQTVKETRRALGRIDILLNMASIYLNTPDPNDDTFSPGEPGSHRGSLSLVL